MKTNHKLDLCHICKTKKHISELIPAEVIRPALIRLIEKEHPGWSHEGFICTSDLNRFRVRYVQDVLEAESGEISALESEVLQSLKENDLVANNIAAEFDARMTRSQRWADRLAEMGGSWGFIVGFGIVVFSWIAINSFLAISKPFDPYPFILLNLVLSCLAAIQAPVILMSHNRMEARDRVRSEQDYKTDLKAEVEIRNLHEKIDHLLKHQWTRLLEIQELQLQILNELSQKKTG